MKKKKHEKRGLRKIGFFVLFFVFICAALSLTFLFDSKILISAIGLHNSYAVMFALTLLGGMSTFTSGMIYTSIFAMLQGGAHPLMLGLIVGIAAAIGDLLFYAVFSEGHKSLSDDNRDRVRKLVDWLEKRDKRYIPVIAVIWIFLPFPNDIMTFSLSIMGYPLKKMYPYIIIGDIGNMVLISLLFFMSFI